MEAKLQTATSSGAEYSTISEPEVGALDCPQVLLQASLYNMWGVTVIIWLSMMEYKTLGLHRLPGSSFSLILLIQRLELLSQDLM